MDAPTLRLVLGTVTVTSVWNTGETGDIDEHPFKNNILVYTKPLIYDKYTPWLQIVRYVHWHFKFS